MLPNKSNAVTERVEHIHYIWTAQEFIPPPLGTCMCIYIYPSSVSLKNSEEFIMELEEEKGSVFCFPGTQIPYGTSDIKEKGRVSLESSKAKKRHYSCKYCNRKFSSFQALGGHQNGHKYEKEVARQRKRSTAVPPVSCTSLENNINIASGSGRRACLSPAMAFADGCAGSKCKGKGLLMSCSACICMNSQTAVAVPQLRIGHHIIHRPAAESNFGYYNDACGTIITSNIPIPIPIPNSYNYYIPPPHCQTKNPTAPMSGNLDLDLSLKL